MSFKSNYQIHNELYKKARERGDASWGGDKDGSRYKNWKQTLDSFDSLDFFPHKGRVLDLGCGNGTVALQMAKKGYEVYGIDVSKEAIDWALEIALKEGNEVAFSVGSVVDLSRYEDGFFDVVIDSNCLHCILGDDREKVLSEVSRVLKRNGLFYLSTQCGMREFKGMNVEFNEETRIMTLDGAPYRYFGNPDNVKSEIEGAELEIIQSTMDLNENQHLKLFAKKVE